MFAERFLTHPELFPARIGGEPWGTASSTIVLAGEGFAVTDLSDGQHASLDARLGSHAGASANPLVIRMLRAPASDFREIDTRGWEYWLDIDWQRESIAIAGLRLMARISLRENRGAIWTPVDDAAEAWGIIENVMRPALAARLLARGGLLVHSAAVRGHVFAGQSGAGKSTIARLSIESGLPVGSDDLNAIVPSTNGFEVAPLPFTGDLDRDAVTTAPQPLRAIVSLEKGDREALREMSLAQTVSLLTRAAPYVNQDEERTAELLDRASAIAASAARLTLTFRRDGDVWPILEPRA